MFSGSNSERYYDKSCIVKLNYILFYWTMSNETIPGPPRHINSMALSEMFSSTNYLELEETPTFILIGSYSVATVCLINIANNYYYYLRN